VIVDFSELSLSSLELFILNGVVGTDGPLLLNDSSDTVSLMKEDNSLLLKDGNIFSKSSLTLCQQQIIKDTTHQRNRIAATTIFSENEYFSFLAFVFFLVVTSGIFSVVCSDGLSDGSFVNVALEIERVVVEFSQNCSLLAFSK
jgi:hypothetical protein